jgi:hypothetical protein
MTDIVERLRDRSLVIQYPERERIASEIERLRAIIREGGWTDQDIDKWVAARAADQPDAARALYERQAWSGATPWDDLHEDTRQLWRNKAATGQMHPDQQSARKGLDELTRMAQEDGLYDVEPCAAPAKAGDVVTFADGRKFVVTSTPDKT